MIKTEEKTLDIKELLEKQSILTEYIRNKKHLGKVDMDKQISAIICELWESANELKSEGFKEWTNKKRTDHLLEETVDVLHLYLQIGNILQVVTEHYWIEKHPTIMKQYLAINTTLLAIDGPLMWALSFAQYRGLVDMLGFDWEHDIIPAYDAKYQENFARQDRGY